MSLLKDGLGIEEPETRMKYARLIRMLDGIELEHLKTKLTAALNKR